MARTKPFGKVTIEPLNGGNGKIVKRFATIEDYADFRIAHCRFFPGEAVSDVYRKQYFSIGNTILNFTFDLR